MNNYEKYSYQIKYNKNTGWVDNWFSNMKLCELIIDNEKYNSVETYYQSQKMTNEKDRIYIKNLSPHLSKTEVKKFKIKDNWNEIKINVMEKALEIKFSLSEWKNLLLKTNNEQIIEWNNWNDKFWGVSVKDFKGQNHLGKILMNIRDKYKYKSLF